MSIKIKNSPNKIVKTLMMQTEEQFGLWDTLFLWANLLPVELNEKAVETMQNMH